MGHTPIVNPIWVWLYGVATRIDNALPGIGGFMLTAFVSLFFATLMVLVFVFFSDNTPQNMSNTVFKYIRKVWKTYFIVFFLYGAVYVFMPPPRILIYMVVADNITTERVEATVDKIEEVVDHIVETIARNFNNNKEKSQKYEVKENN